MNRNMSMARNASARQQQRESNEENAGAGSVCMRDFRKRTAHSGPRTDRLAVRVNFVARRFCARCVEMALMMFNTRGRVH